MRPTIEERLQQHCTLPGSVKAVGVPGWSIYVRGTTYDVARPGEKLIGLRTVQISRVEMDIPSALCSLRFAADRAEVYDDHMRLAGEYGGIG